MHYFDIAVQQYFLYARTPRLTEFFYLVTVFFDVSALTVLLTLCIAVLVGLFRGRKYAWLLVSALALGAILSTILKYVFDVGRPLGGVMHVVGPSFPSYHSTEVIILFVTLMWIFDRKFSPIGRVIFNVLCLSAIIIVAGSRLYLGVHWLSDVLGGIALGLFTVYGSVYIFKRKFIKTK